MKVLDTHTIRTVADDGSASFETVERWLDLPDVLTPEEAVEAARLADIEQANAAIIAQLDALDVAKGIRAISDALDGDRTHLDALNAQKAALRVQIKPLPTSPAP